MDGLSFLNYALPIIIVVILFYVGVLLTDPIPNNSIKHFISPILLTYVITLQAVSCSEQKTIYYILIESCLVILMIVYQLSRVSKWKKRNEEAAVKFAAALARKAFRDTEDADKQRQLRGEMCSVLLSMLYLTGMPVALMKDSEISRELFYYFHDSQTEELFDLCNKAANLSSDRFKISYASAIHYLKKAAGIDVLPT